MNGAQVLPILALCIMLGAIPIAHEWRRWKARRLVREALSRLHAGHDARIVGAELIACARDAGVEIEAMGLWTREEEDWTELVRLRLDNGQ